MVGEPHPVLPGRYLAVLSVDVVDGSGEGVAHEPVTARFRLPGGYERVLTRSTDVSGHVSLVDELLMPAQSVVVSASGETTGDLAPAPGAKVTLEV